MAATKKAKKELHPALRANADKLKAGEALSPGKKKRPATAVKTAAKKTTATKASSATASKKRKRG